MSQKNKSIIKIFLIVISLSILSGCTNAKEVSFQDYSIESTESIEFISEQFKKVIDKYEDIKLIQNLFKKIDVEKSFSDEKLFCIKDLFNKGRRNNIFQNTIWNFKLYYARWIRCDFILAKVNN